MENPFRQAYDLLADEDKQKLNAEYLELLEDLSKNNQNDIVKRIAELQIRKAAAEKRLDDLVSRYSEFQAIGNIDSEGHREAFNNVNLMRAEIYKIDEALVRFQAKQKEVMLNSSITPSPLPKRVLELGGGGTPMSAWKKATRSGSLPPVAEASETQTAPHGTILQSSNAVNVQQSTHDASAHKETRSGSWNVARPNKETRSSTQTPPAIHAATSIPRSSSAGLVTSERKDSGVVLNSGVTGSAPPTTGAKVVPQAVTLTPPPIIQTALKAISPVIKSFEEKNIDLDRAAQQVALAIFQADRDMHVMVLREKEKKFGMRGNQKKMEHSHLHINKNGILESDKEEYNDCRKIREELKFFTDDVAKMVATGTNFISKMITQSLAEKDPKLKEKKLEMWLKVLKILDNNHDYEGIATLYYGIVGAFPVKTLPGEGESVYMLQREDDARFIDDKIFNKLMEYRKLIERGATKDYFLPTVTENIESGHHVIPSFHTFNVPALYGNEQFNRSLKLISPIEIKATETEADIKKRQEDIQSRQKTVERMRKEGKDIIKTIYESKDTALGLIMSLERAETRLPDEITLRTASLLSQADVKMLQPPPPEELDETLSTTMVLGVRKGTRELPLTNPLTGLESRINKAIELQQMLENEQNRLGNEKKDLTEIKKQLFDINYGLLNLEKERLKLLGKSDFDDITKSLDNQLKYITHLKVLSKELVASDRKNTAQWHEKSINLDKELAENKEQRTISYDSRSAKKYKESLSDKSEGELNFENIELNKNGIALLNNFSVPKSTESNQNYLTQLSNQLVRIKDYESYMMSKFSKNLSVELNLTKNNLESTINVVRLNEDFQKLIEKQKSLPPLSTAEYNNKMGDIYKRSQAILSVLAKEENIQNITKKPMSDVFSTLDNIFNKSRPSALNLEQSPQLNTSWMIGKKQT